MNRAIRVFGWIFILFLAHALMISRVNATPTITNPECLAVTINQPGIIVPGLTPCATENSQFVFRAVVVPAMGFQITFVSAVIDPDPTNPELGGTEFPMNRDPSQANGWRVSVTGLNINGGHFNGPIVHRWSIRAADNQVPPGGMFMDNVVAAPKPAAALVVFQPQDLEILPVGPDYLPDKRSIPGQLGNGLRIDPANPTSPNDAGAAHIFTWRVRVRSQFVYGNIVGGLPPQFFLRRGQYEWHDTRGAFDTFPFFLDRRNSGVILVLVGPDGLRHYCPMEIDPDNPNNIANGLIAGGIANDRVTYPEDPRFGGHSIYLPVGGGPWQNGQGVFYRFRMMPTQYIFNHGGLPGEGPFTAFGGPTLPDSLPAIPIGYGSGADTEVTPSEVWGRVFNNQYSAFAGPDRTIAPGIQAPPFPFYTDIAGRSGQWQYYYVGTTDFRPPTRNGAGANFDPNWFPAPFDSYGADPDGYLFNYDSDTGLAPGDPSLPYGHPYVTPMLSDGGWTDDLPENGWGPPFGISSNSHRSRATTKTRVRFMVRVTQPTQASTLLVRVFIDGAAHAMQPLPVAGNNIYANGVIYFYDQTFPGGTEGRHWMYYEADDGNHKVIWPRRDSNLNPNWTGTGATNPPIPDLQANFLSGAKGNSVDFGTGTVGVNFLDEPFVNNRPELFNPTVAPPSGISGQAFTYTVFYYDADGDEPVDGIVNIDGTDYRMNAADTNPTNFAPGGVKTGRQYKFVINALPKQAGGAPHTYYFKFRDNWNNFANYRISAIRREFGEWVTQPAGDDNGNPAFVFTGPTMTDNVPAELYEPNFFFSDPSQTPATLYDFAVKYRDPENQPPATIKIYLSKDDGATYDQGTSLVKAEASTNYAAGVQFHLPVRIHLAYSADNKNPPAFKYRYKFAANDGTDDTTVLHIGTGANALTNNTAHVLKGVAPSPLTIFADPNGSRNWISTGLHIFRTRGAVKRELNGPGTISPEYGYSPADLVAGQIVLVSAALPGDVISASYYFVDLPGPTINKNHAPTLTEPTPPPPGDPNTNNGTLTPLSGQPADTFTYSIIYTDADNQDPITSNGQKDKIDLIVDNDTTRTPPLQLSPATPQPWDFIRGVKFTLVVAGTTLGIGPHTYHFETTDGSDIARFPLATANPTELNGPTITDNQSLKLPPTPNFPNDVAISPFPKGKSNDQYTFTVVYQSATGQAPPSDIELRVRNNTTNVITNVKMNPIDPIGMNGSGYINGIRYQVGLTAPAAPLTVGDHDITFGFSGLGAATTPRTLTVNSPPTLAISSNPAEPIIDGSTFSVAGDIHFNIKYTDANGDLPQRPAGGPNTLKLVITKPDTTLVATLDPTSPAVAPTAAQIKAGVIYSWTVQAKSVVDNASPLPQQFKYYIQAKDDVEDSIPPQIPALPGGDFTVKAASPFTLTSPVTGGNETLAATFLSPTSGGTSTVYTYKVKYTHPDNIPPVSIQLIIDPGANQIVKDMTRADANAFSAGTVYQYATVPPELAPGTHKFIFKAADRINTITKYQSGTTPYTGPLVNTPPVLTLGTVYIQNTTPTFPTNNVIAPPVSGNIFSKFIFKVTYSDTEGTPPTFIQAKLNDGSPVIPLHATVATPDFSGGKTVDFVSDPLSLTPGTKTFHFETKDNVDPAFLPAQGTDISGLVVRNVPVLSSPATGTLSPLTGPVSTTFTYQVTYTHADNTAPASVQVFIDGTSHDMTKVGTGAFTAGVLYQYSQRFPANATTTHNYRFQAVDTIDPTYFAKLPVDGSTLPGPTLNQPVFVTPTFTPNPGVVGAQLKIDSQLVIAPESAQGIAIKVVRPDGTGIPSNKTTNADGTFSYTFTPDQTGDWKISFFWAGQQGVYDAITTEFPFKVVGFSMTLPNGLIDLIASPIIPVSPDPSLYFGAAKPDGTSLPITELELIKWLPNLGPTGQYVFLNRDSSFPGITGGQGYWVKPHQTVVINPRGKLTDQSQPYSIPLQVGWNMIGSVYLQDINWSAVKVRFQGALLSLADAGDVMRPIAWAYDPNSGSYVMIDTNSPLKTGRGYWVKALQPCELVLGPPGTREAKVTRAAVDRGVNLQIGVRSGRLADLDTYVPLTGLTASRIALMEKPPFVSDYVSVRLLDQSQLPSATRVAAPGSHVVAFQVETSQKKSDVSIVFPNVSTLGRKVEMTLVDIANGTRRSIGSNSGFTFNTGDNTLPRKFALVVTPRTINGGLIISDVHSNGRGVAGLSFSFNISAPANLKAQILGANGLVRDLSSGRSVTRGVNELVWDGKTARGAAAAAGAYVLKLTATDDTGRQTSAIMPITLVR